MSLFATVKTKSFSDASHPISWGEFSQTDCVHLHGIGVSGGLQVGGEGGERQAMSLFEGKDASFLPMEVDGFVHPGFE